VSLVVFAVENPWYALDGFCRRLRFSESSAMKFRWTLSFLHMFVLFVLQSLALGALLGLVAGSAVALFLWLLSGATQLHWQYPWLLLCLPLAGLITHWLYQTLEPAAEGGNRLILEQIREPGDGVPFRMAPLVLAGTLLSHVCGGSTGREGTAVQIGGSLASSFGRRFRLPRSSIRTLLATGIAAGFGAVFGTPLAGTLFALEVPATGRRNLRALLPCLIAALVGDAVAHAWGTQHTVYLITSVVPLSEDSGIVAGDFLRRLPQLICAGCLFGLAARLFVAVIETVRDLLKKQLHRPWLRPAAGGLVVIFLTLALGRRDYLGLGVDANPDSPLAVTLKSCFQSGGADWFSWWWKLLFTAVTVGSGFKGGEVTPLFFIGAALGHSLGRAMELPVDQMAGFGFVAVFAGATRTPLASVLLSLELFAPNSPDLLNSLFPLEVAVVCRLASLCCGSTTIYGVDRADGIPQAS
jgi:H+/Cl- antiporter ClcA